MASSFFFSFLFFLPGHFSLLGEPMLSHLLHASLLPLPMLSLLLTPLLLPNPWLIVLSILPALLLCFSSIMMTTHSVALTLCSLPTSFPLFVATCHYQCILFGHHPFGHHYSSHSLCPSCLSSTLVSPLLDCIEGTLLDHLLPEPCVTSTSTPTAPWPAFCIQATLHSSWPRKFLVGFHLINGTQHSLSFWTLVHNHHNS